MEDGDFVFVVTRGGVVGWLVGVAEGGQELAEPIALEFDAAGVAAFASELLAEGQVGAGQGAEGTIWSWGCAGFGGFLAPAGQGVLDVAGENFG